MDLSMYVFYTLQERQMLHDEFYGKELKGRRTAYMRWAMALLGL